MSKQFQFSQAISLKDQSSESLKAEQQAIDEILLLLKQLAQQESTTVKLILDRLYDIGAGHLINEKVKAKALNRISKAIATQSKPLFRFVGIRWFQQNSPQLIADWLYEQVQFQTLSSGNQSTLEATVVPEANATFNECTLENHKLRSQLRWSTRLLGGALAFTSGLLLATNTTLSRRPLPTSPSALPVTVQSIRSLD